METINIQDELKQSVELLAGSRGKESESVEAGEEAQIKIESSPHGLRIRVSYQIDATELPKSLSDHHNGLAKQIHETTENVLNQSNTLERVPTMAMFTAIYDT
jgi:hypothetical protein